MKHILSILLLLILSVAAASAGEIFDGKKNLICASVEAMDCTPGEPCDKGLPDDIGAPQFMRIDFANKKILGPQRTTPILHLEQTDSQFLLQGVEMGMGWVFALDRTTGKFSATLADGGGAFVIFGACTPL